MKNIYVIPTDKPSRLYSKDGNHILDTTMAIDWYISSACYKPQNIYITSSNDIEVGDYYYLPRVNSIYKCIEDATGLNLERRLGVGKIVLTTDPELINDGVQGIDDEFLNWFIKNPGCDYVKVEVTEISGIIPNFGDVDKYRIVIPKEEPKQTDENGKPLTYWGGLAEHKQETLEEEPKQITSLDGDVLGGIPKGILTMLIGEKEETLKEAAEKYVNINVAKNAAKLMYKEHFIAGAKWQQQRSYSEQEAFNLIMEFSSRDRNSSSGTPHSIAKWFEKNKKK